MALYRNKETLLTYEAISFSEFIEYAKMSENIRDVAYKGYNMLSFFGRTGEEPLIYSVFKDNVIINSFVRSEYLVSLPGDKLCVYSADLFNKLFETVQTL